MSEDREVRNSVFQGQAPQGVQPGMPTISTADRVKADFGLDIPVELVPLPSGGRVYQQGSPLASRESLEIRAMTAKEEDILTSRALLKKGTAITELIRSCIMDKSVNVSDLLVGDRNALMVAVRITGYGAEYPVDLECPECDAKTQHVFNLGELPLRRLSIDPVAENNNLFEFVLPVSKKNVKFKFLTGRDEDDMAAMAEKQKKHALGNESAVTTGLQYAIVSVEGVTDRSKIANFVKNMPAMDSRALRAYIRENEPGIVMKQDVACEKCGHSEEVDMPLGVNFFWPSS